ncbi:hypothetical protein SAMN05519103_01947 [Rhizobiales bacterium GAS113]|nr:hypothetical protein SAMN05519103_01947 [Rhizobiales bacterium GAS113]
MTQMLGPGPCGFISNEGGPPAGTPLKTAIWRRVRPVCELQVDAWLLRPGTLREIAADLHRQAQAAGRARHFADRDMFDDAADAVDTFISARRVYGEGRSPWR